MPFAHLPDRQLKPGKEQSLMDLLKPGVAVAFGLVAFGCAGAPRPTDQLASAEASMRAAQELKAQQEPKAELHMKLAQEQIAKAHKLLDDGDNEEAARVLTRARADAELAIALSKQAQAEREQDAVTKSSPSASIPVTSPNASASASR
jgi:hypothetical protein